MGECSRLESKSAGLGEFALVLVEAEKAGCAEREGGRDVDQIKSSRTNGSGMLESQALCLFKQ